MIGLKELLLVVFAAEQVLSRDTSYCYAYNDKPYLKFGTRTAYHFVQGGRTPYEPIPHCRPVQIWMLIRHGTKYPESDIIERMKTLPKLRDDIIENHETQDYGHLCNADLENLRMWHLEPAVKVESAEKLTEQGVEELNLLGRRMKSNFPELFPPVISNVSSANYKFRLSNEELSLASSKTAFMSGAFDRVDIPDAEIPPNDNLFTSYRKCLGWKNEVANNPELQTQVNSFAVGPEIQNLTSNVSRRLGFLNNMTVESIVDMWNMCRFDKAWNISALSPWCAVFTEEELKILVYNETLNDYYTRGPSHEFNLRLGCPPMKHLFEHFEKLEGDDYSNEPKGIFNIVGSRSVHLFMAAMGIAKDPTPPLASDFRSMDKQQWSTSEIGPFAVNIAAIFYKCNTTGSSNKVMFYLAEKPMRYEGCTAGLCDWEYLKNKFPNATSDCNLDFCHRNLSIPN